jgi:hypothetical protein
MRTQAPNNARSVLYQKLPDDAPSPGAKLLYVKMEPFDYRGLSTQEAAHPDRTEPGFKGAFKLFFANLKETLARIFSLDPSRAAIRAGVDNLERVPDNLVFNYNLLVDSFITRHRKSRALAPIIRDLLRARIDSNTGGVHAAFKALNKAEAQASALVDDPDGHKQRFLALLREFRLVLTSKVGDHPELRFGREVILTGDDFGPICPKALSCPDWEVEISFNRTFGHLESQIIEAHMNIVLAGQGEDRLSDLDGMKSDFERFVELVIYDPFTDERYIPPSQGSSPYPKASPMQLKGGL